MAKCEPRSKIMQTIEALAETLGLLGIGVEVEDYSPSTLLLLAEMVRSQVRKQKRS